MATDPKQLPIRDMMDPNPVCVRENTPVQELFDLFQAQQPDCVAVVDESGRLQGCILPVDLEKSRQLFELKEFLGLILSQLDVGTRNQVSEIFALDTPIDLKSREIMRLATAKAHPDQVIAEVLPLLRTGKTHTALVLDNENRVVGQVSALDLLACLV